MADEKMRLELETLKFEQISTIKQSLSALNAEAMETVLAFERGDLTLEEYDAEMKRVNNSVVNLGRTLKGLEAEQARVTAATMQGTEATQGFKTGMQQGAYAIGDFMSTSGGWGQRLNSIANNIQFVGAQFGPWGMAAGLAVQGVATALTVYERSIGKATEHIGDAVKQIQGQIEELEDKPIKLAVDFMELDALKAKLEEVRIAEQGLKSFRGLRTGFETESGQNVEEVFRQAPGGARAATDKLTGSLNKQQEAAFNKEIADAEAAAQDKIKVLKESGGLGSYEDEIRVINLEVEKKRQEVSSKRASFQKVVNEKIGALLAAAKSGDQGAQTELAGRLRGAGLGGMAGEIEGATPAALQAFDEEVNKQNVELNDRRRSAQLARFKNAPKIKAAAALAKMNEDQAEKDAARAERAKEDARKADISCQRRRCSAGPDAGPDPAASTR